MCIKMCNGQKYIPWKFLPYGKCYRSNVVDVYTKNNSWWLQKSLDKNSQTFLHVLGLFNTNYYLNNVSQLLFVSYRNFHHNIFMVYAEYSAAWCKVTHARYHCIASQQIICLFSLALLVSSWKWAWKRKI